MISNKYVWKSPICFSWARAPSILEINSSVLWMPLRKHLKQTVWPMYGHRLNQNSKDTSIPGNNAITLAANWKSFCMYTIWVCYRYRLFCLQSFEFFFSYGSCNIKEGAYVYALVFRYIASISKNPNFTKFAQDFNKIAQQKCASHALYYIANDDDLLDKLLATEEQTEPWGTDPIEPTETETPTKPPTKAPTKAPTKPTKSTQSPPSKRKTNI